MPKLPVIGEMTRGKTVILIGASGAVAAFLIYRNVKEKKAAPASGYGYGATAYGYGDVPAGFYGYGYGYGMAGAGITPYPVGSEYGYGAFGYGYYNPYTGQWLGSGQGGTTGAPTPTPTPTPTPKPGGAKYPPLPNPTYAQEVKAWSPSRPASMRGFLFVRGKWYSVPEPPTGVPTSQQTHTITASGTQTLAATGRANHISEFQLLAYNPNLAYLYGSRKPIPRGTRVKV